jgi:hypothetical protein
LSTTYSIWHYPNSNPDHRGGKPATNQPPELWHGTCNSFFCTPI